MNGEIICVGTELLLGDTLNTNAHFLAKELSALGINIYHQTTVGDNAVRLKAALGEAISRSEIIFFTGGLGPTKDDITKETIAAALGISMFEDAQTLKRIEDYFSRVGREMSETNKKQAQIPSGATIFQNDNGTAPGLALAAKSQVIIMLPGPPSELVPMFEKSVKPFLSAFCNTTIVSHNIRLFGIGESVAAEKLGDLLDGSNPTVAPYAGTGEVTIRVSAAAKNKEEADAICAPAIAQIKEILGQYIYGIDIENLQEALVNTLKENHQKIATAESCTAGLLSKKLTEVSGSSGIFDMGIVAYANSVKTDTLGVPADIIARYGAVSPQTAAGMALGIRKAGRADIGVSITGIAGPDSSENKPVGLVYIAACDSENVYVKRLLLGRGNGEDREYIREVSAKSALSLALTIAADKPNENDPVSARDIYNEGEFGDIMYAPAAPIEQKKVITNAAISAVPPPEPPQLPSDDIMSKSPAAAYAPVEKPLKVELPPEPKPALKLEDFSNNAMKRTDRMNNNARRPVPAKKRRKKRKIPWYQKLLPWKGDGAGEVIRKLIFIIAITAFIVSGVKIAQYYLAGYSTSKENEKLAEQYPDEPTDEIGEDGIRTDLKPFLAINEEVIGWLKIDGMNIDHPVLQHKGSGSIDNLNLYYIDHNIYKKWDTSGALFLDSGAIFTKTDVSQNLVVYGHNMNAFGNMFNNLKKYRDFELYKEHPLIKFDTLYSLNKYKVFAVFITTVSQAEDKGYVFEYWKQGFNEQAEFADWIKQIKLRSLYSTMVDVKAGDHILTLSTCFYDLSHNSRLVVMARKIRAGESEQVDTAGARLNNAPLYPQIWYNKYGGSKPQVGEAEYDFNAYKPIHKEPETTSAKTSTSSKASSKPTSTSKAATSKSSSTSAPVSDKPTSTVTTSAEPESKEEETTSVEPESEETIDE